MRIEATFHDCCRCNFCEIHGRYGHLVLDSIQQTDSENDVVLIDGSPPVEINEEKSNDGIVVNEVAISPKHSENLSNNDKVSTIEISDESNHSTQAEPEGKFSHIERN